MSHSSSVHDVIITHVISGDTQTNKPPNRCRKRKTTLVGPAGHTINFVLIKLPIFVCKKKL